MTAPLRFHIQTGLSRPELGLLWRDLEARADPTFFLSWDWIGAWLAELEPLPPIVVGEAGGALVLLGALVPRRRVEGGIVRVDGLFLHTTGERAKDVIAIEYNGFLVDRAWALPPRPRRWPGCSAPQKWPAAGGRSCTSSPPARRRRRGWCRRGCYFRCPRANPRGGSISPRCERRAGTTLRR